jgi:hypothetical protein
MTYNQNKWGSLLGNSKSKWHKAVVAQMLQNQQKYMKQLYEHHRNYGPYYCNHNGHYISANDAANPKYIPHVKFWSEDGTGGKRTWIYNLSTEDFYEYEIGSGLFIISREDIPDWIIEEIFKRIPELYSGSIGDFTKFAFPLIRKSFPSIISQNIVSVQPMTQPVGGISFYRPRYASGTKKPV